MIDKNKRRYFALLCNDTYVEIWHTDDGSELTTRDFEDSGDTTFNEGYSYSVHEVNIESIKLINIDRD